MNVNGITFSLVLSLLTAYPSIGYTDGMVELGEKLFFDPNLSEPAGQSCASCHLPTAGFADPDRELPVSRGIHPDRFGDRNTPGIAYSMYSPELYFDKDEQHYVGGQFYDGRARTLEEQAKQPLLNPLEMANPDKLSVVSKVRKSDYVEDFLKVFGKSSLSDVNTAYDNLAVAIAAFERSSIFRSFTSKYDFYLAGKAKLTEQEKRGLKLFEAEDKGNCAACHPSQPDDKGNPPLFTDFTYDNLGLPANRDNPFYTQSSKFNPDGKRYVDIGLAKTTARVEDRGKFKVTTLRNIAITPPYFHNGIFGTLKEVVDFYNTRDTRSDWGKPEVSENVNTDELGDLGLSDEEVDDIVAFMKTLTDGYRP
ncbi:MAG: cytochrome-c peroxidase [Gammaproteobacteria bacterium]|nr:cytochrome-c peroxidase [Gammaproteobacteria bacterium]